MTNTGEQYITRAVNGGRRAELRGKRPTFLVQFGLPNNIGQRWCATFEDALEYRDTFLRTSRITPRASGLLAWALGARDDSRDLGASGTSVRPYVRGQAQRDALTRLGPRQTGVEFKGAHVPPREFAEALGKFIILKAAGRAGVCDVLEVEGDIDALLLAACESIGLPVRVAAPIKEVAA